MYEEIENEKIHSSDLDGETRDGSNNLVESSMSEFFEEEDDSFGMELIRDFQIISGSLLDKYMGGIFCGLQRNFQTKQDAIKFIESVKACPEAMEQKCKELGIYTPNGPYGERLNLAQFFKIDYDFLARVFVINRKFIQSQEAFEEQHLKLMWKGIGIKLHLSAKEIYTTKLDEKIKQNLGRFDREPKGRPMVIYHSPSVDIDSISSDL